MLMKKKTSQLHDLVIHGMVKNQPFALALVLELLYQCDMQVTHSQSSTMENYGTFTLHTKGSWASVAKTETKLPLLQKKLGMNLLVERTEPFDKTSIPYLPYEVNVLCMEKEDILYFLSTFFKSEAILIEESKTFVETHGLARLLHVHMRLNIPLDVHLPSIKEEFLNLCETHNLDGDIQLAAK